MIRVLFVCTGNICRSPTAEGVFRNIVTARGLTAGIDADSCGISAWHAGEAPDPRSCEAALRRGLDLSALRARALRVEDYHDFDLLLAMDESHLRHLRRYAPSGMEGKLHLFLQPVVDKVGRSEVPDPYYSGDDGFDLVLDLIETGCEAWIDRIYAGK